MIIGESLKQTKIVAFFDLIPFPPNHRYNNSPTAILKNACCDVEEKKKE